MKATTATRRAMPAASIHLPMSTKDELLTCIQLGVQNAFLVLALDTGPSLTGEGMYDAIIQGVRQAHQDIARDGTFAQARKMEGMAQ